MNKEEVKAENKSPLTVNNYNKYCEDGIIKNVSISFNDKAAKYNKYGHYKVGDSYVPIIREKIKMINNEKLNIKSNMNYRYFFMDKLTYYD